MLGRLLMFSFRKYISIFSDNPPILDKATVFPACDEFDSNTCKIAEELKSYILNNWETIPSFDSIDKKQRALVKNDPFQWRMLVVKMYGKYTNTHVSPTLLSLTEKYDHLISSATISCMEAKKHIPAHCGPNKAVLRYTLPLVVPKEGECSLTVAGEKLPLKEGVGILWDDTYLHEVINNTNGVRIALLLDIKRKLPRHIDLTYEFILMLARKTKRFKDANQVATLGQ